MVKKSCCHCHELKEETDFYISYIKEGKKVYSSTCKPCNKVNATAYRRRKYCGITKEQYNQLIIDQNNNCAICKKPESLLRNGKLGLLSVDHCHKTKKHRGLLCFSCNTLLGKVKEDINILKNAISYLEKYKNE